ncbi:undecaprenyldiphospho-muramoylpentapeptide beta-N-acetylglucosaminyltransferase [Geomesophilobacter sediminis]|uniref:UDP-N-acetylglucosamine--N-acetylmuramyl-(pentapeptide) pyrophosphoryl-undecaprenol N-acetylglucosamine transferase n=1 Tax=Geomesophilobacter sediminis TaxID=2798584 RepID=A0A8J7M115_9BACT|nr:undecaprenyldiphospho-muramoylpentapeptide beta-N-acetylglucosaminyltransferase [Geomesophilobacter sediminis]MBJ6726668.1 undecaprenyldiphospho-muramoylpentapeptide beta-N-acetylglucosaminyltransferase [Geomesophilobacter sediminis]
MKMIIAGGGTGGHLFPGIAVADEFLATNSENKVLFVGTERGIEARLLPKLGYELGVITGAGIKGRGTWGQFKSAMLLLNGYAQSRKILKEFQPDIVLGVGGYASAPLLLAARGMGIKKIFIHEQNAIPGLANKILSRFSQRIFISMAESAALFPEGRTLLTGNPIRKEILWRFQERQRKVGDEFRILVFGGSAGAHRINLTMLEALPHLAAVRDRLVITHQTGEKDCEEIRAGYQAQGVKANVAPFIEDMAAAYGAADLVICRAGATTIAEVTACGKGCIFIPYPYAADDHQRKNAEALVNKKAGFMILEEELNGEVLAGEILRLKANPEALAEVERNARSLAHLDAAQVIVTEMVRADL